MKEIKAIKKAIINEYNAVNKMQGKLNTDTKEGMVRWENLSHYSNGLRFALDLLEEE